MKELGEKVNELNQSIVEYKFKQALDKFYSEEVVSVENEGDPTIGLSAYREAATKFFDNVTNYSATLITCFVSNNMSVSEWHYTFDHKEWGHWDKVQISIQRWGNGKIIHERHHYDH